MLISVSSQAYVFLWSIIGGALIAFVYDLFRIKRKTVRTVNILTHIEDLVYWILVALIMFGVVYYSNEGEIRGYIFIGTIIGVTLYTLLLSKAVMASCLLVISVISRIFLTMWKIVTFPVRLVLKILAGPVKYVLKLLKKLFRGARRSGKNNLSRMAVWGRRFKNIIKKI